MGGVYDRDRPQRLAVGARGPQGPRRAMRAGDARRHQRLRPPRERHQARCHDLQPERLDRRRTSRAEGDRAGARDAARRRRRGAARELVAGTGARPMLRRQGDPAARAVRAVGFYDRAVRPRASRQGAGRAGGRSPPAGLVGRFRARGGERGPGGIAPEGGAARRIMILGIFLYCAVVAGLAAAVTYGVARRRLLLDHPNERSSHATPVPRSGGLGIVTATVLGMLALGIDGHPAVLRDHAFFAVLLGGLIAAMGGFADDVSTRSFLFKLGVQSAAGGIAIALGLVVDTLYIAGIGPVHLGAFGPVVTLLWLVGRTNPYHFSDRIARLAGGTAVICPLFPTLAALHPAPINQATNPF